MDTDLARDQFDRGYAALEADDFHEAIDCFTRAIDLKPTVAAGYRYRAFAHLGRKDRPAALRDFAEAIRLKADDPQLRYERGLELYKQRSYESAAADCDAGLRLDPGRADIYGLRGRCRAALGESDAALADFGEALARDPDEAATYRVFRGVLLMELGRAAEAKADAEAALMADPDSGPAKHLLANLAGV
jgi:serine/threonine-protein kinase